MNETQLTEEKLHRPIFGEKAIDVKGTSLQVPATILHLSDLHLGKHFYDGGERNKGSIKGFFKRRRNEMQAHDPFILSGLPADLKCAARAIGSQNDDFDCYVVTGDIATNGGAPERFEFARNYLTNKINISPKFSAGLALDSSRLICIPGNHDVHGQETPDLYLHHFRDLPEPPPFKKDVVASNGRRLIFYGIDSNEYKEGSIAAGEIQPATLGWLSRELTEINSEDDKLTGTLRILLLHHHPCNLNRFKASRSLLSVIFDHFTVLKEADRLLNLIHGRIDIVMHGHEHLPIAFQDEESGCLVVSAGTTSEWQPRPGNNNFNVLVIEEARVDVHRFDWQKGRFGKASAPKSFAIGDRGVTQSYGE